MDIPVNLFFWLMGTVPIILLIIFMVILQWGALKAAPTTLLITIMLSMTVFRGSLTVIGVELLRASWSSLSIILVILTAILLYEVSNEVNAFETLNRLFKTVAPNELIRILLIGVVFASFLQGVTGFGVPVLVTAPLLVQIGVAPMWAVIIPLVGHSWAGTFGTLAIAWEALLDQFVVEGAAFLSSTAFFAALFLLILTVSANFFIAYAYGKMKAVKKGFVAIILISLVQGGGQLVMSQINPELASFLPSALTLMMIILLSKSGLYNKDWALEDSRIMLARSEEDKPVRKMRESKPTMSVLQSLVPYILMTVITLTGLLFTPLNALLRGVSFGPDFIETTTGYGVVNPAVENFSPIYPFVHAGMFLFLSALLSFLYYKKKNLVFSENPVRGVLTRTLRKAMSPSIAVLSLLAISRVMAGTGQTMVLAEGMTIVLGSYYTSVAPFVGLLGSFITGSNMSSNILFGNFQYLTADFIGLNVPAVVGAQTAGGAIGMSLAPGNVVLGTSATGILGSEGKVLIKIIPFTITVAVIIGIVMLLLHI
ncbi:L-lactate permease [Alkalibacterium sp.]|nr:MAG: L-lactate permease [Alkalibacterium sp.]